MGSNISGQRENKQSQERDCRNKIKAILTENTTENTNTTKFQEHNDSNQYTPFNIILNIEGFASLMKRN